jgi:dipeptidyl aminopeptidase/acylaminoacyl peptidase
LLAAAGFIVLQPNYRGSDNLGNAYQRAIAPDAGAGPGRDVMAGIAAVEKLGIVDDSRIGISGWSYGGYMTSWMITHYHIWKAAVSGAAVDDWVVDYSIADDHKADELQLHATPQSDPQLYRDVSPLTYAKDVTTPTLIMCDTGDPRVPIPESYEFYHALIDNNIPVTFVAYPVSGHLPDDPVRNADIDRRWVGWLKDHV